MPNATALTRLIAAPLLTCSLAVVPALFGVAVAHASENKAPEAAMSHAGMQMDIAELSPTGAVDWDAEATEELTAALHELHDVWNRGDIESLKKYMIGDDVLVTFELDPTTHKPLKLRSKADIDAFVSQVDTDQQRDHLVTKLEHPLLRCRATKSWGICTEECTVKFLDAETQKHVATDELISTQIAVNTPEGWRWIQWHMSQWTKAESVPLRTHTN